METDIHSVLDQFLKVKGVTGAALVGRDGFVIESSTSHDIDMDSLGALVATAIGTAESLGKEFDLGAVDQYMAEFANGKVVMSPAMDDILAVSTDSSAVIGGVRYAIKRNLDDVIAALT